MNIQTEQNINKKKKKKKTNIRPYLVLRCQMAEIGFF